jgi:hypothetical protein
MRTRLPRAALVGAFLVVWASPTSADESAIPSGRWVARAACIGKAANGSEGESGVIYCRTEEPHNGRGIQGLRQERGRSSCVLDPSP